MKAGMWPSSDELALCSMWNDNSISTEEIARRLVRTYGSVMAKARNMKLPLRQNSPMLAKRWSDQDDAELKTLWNDAHTAGDIARMMGPEYTAKSVLYRAAALGLQKRSALYKKKKIVKPLGKRAMKKMAEEMAQEIVAGELAAPEFLCIGLMNWKKGQCRFPHGDPQKHNFGWCGRDAVPEKNYCATHHAIAFQPLPPKKAHQYKD